MTRAKVTRGGQISLPAAVRRRWGASELELEDLGDRIVIRPAEDDPITSARGAFAGRLPASDALRAEVRADESAAEDRRGVRA